MAQLESPKFQVQLESTGRILTGIEEYSLDSAYMTSTDAFSFKLYEPDLLLEQNLELHPVVITLDGNVLARGRIEITEIGGETGATVRCEGRDYIADLIECHVDPAVAIGENMTLEQVIKLAAGPVGIDTVSFDASLWRNIRAGQKVQTPIGARSFQDSPLKNYKANPGEGIFEFLNRICARFGCTIQPTTERNTVLLDAPDYNQEVSYFVRRSLASPNSTSNNVLSATARRDYSRFPTVVLVTGKTGAAEEDRTTVAAGNVAGAPILAKLLLGPAANWLVGDASAQQATEALAGSSGEPTPIDNIQKTIEYLLPEGATIFVERIPPKANYTPKNVLYRLMYMRDNLAKDAKQVQNVAARKAAERLKDCLQYQVTVRGHRDPITNRMYTPNTIINVSDELCNVDENLWVEKCTYTYTPNEGAKTQLVCWRSGSFGIGADQ